MVRLDKIDVICDHDGGFTIQKLKGKKWMRTYGHAWHAAQDILNLMHGANPADEWAGNEYGIYPVFKPTFDSVNKGYYRCYTVSSILKIARDPKNCGYRDNYDMLGYNWENICDLIQCLRQHLIIRT